MNTLLKKIFQDALRAVFLVTIGIALMVLTGHQMLTDETTTKTLIGFAIGSGITTLFLLLLYHSWSAIQQHLEKLTEDEENRKQQYKDTGVDANLANLEGRELWETVLSALNVHLFANNDTENRYHFDFQGGHFVLDIDKSYVATVSYLFFDEVELSNVEEVSAVRRAINECSQNSRVNIVYTTDRDEDKMHVHMLENVLLLPNIPYIAAYLQARLTNFFNARHEYEKILDRIRQEA